MQKFKISWLMWYYYLYRECHVHKYHPNHGGCWREYLLNEINYINTRINLYSDEQCSDTEIMYKLFNIYDFYDRPIRLEWAHEE